MRTEFAQCIVDLLVIHGHLWEILFGMIQAVFLYKKYGGVSELIT